MRRGRSFASRVPRTSHSEIVSPNLPVSGLPGVYFREHELNLEGRLLRVLGASPTDVLTARIYGELPYWAVAWPAALALARHLSSLPLMGVPVLELGSGVAIAGLGAAARGARLVATDNQPAALRIAALNARRNGLPLQAVGADWRAWPLSRTFPLVIGSEVTYQPEAYPSLLSTLAETVAPGGQALLSDPGRLSTEQFLQEASDAGWKWERTQLPAEGPQAVWLYRLTRR
jgi:predicted nicotinamide N-methyase